MVITFFKRLWHKFNYLGEPDHYNRGKHDYGYKYFTEFIFESSILNYSLIVVQLIAFIPIVGVAVPLGNLIGAFPDYGLNIRSICLRFALITAIINLVSTVLWIV